MRVLSTIVMLRDGDGDATGRLDDLEEALPSWTRELLACLTPRRRQVLVLREAARLSFDEIGAQLAITGGRARQLHVAAVEALDAAARRGVMLGRVETAVVQEPAPDDAAVTPRTLPVLELPVTALNLSTRAAKCLEYSNVRTVGQLVKLDGKRLLKTRNFGLKSLREVEAALAAVGLKLADPPSDTEAPRTSAGAHLRLVASRDNDRFDDQRDAEHRAQELAYDAWETNSSTKRVALARQALDLWPDCADAYNILADEERDLDNAVSLYLQAVAAGERALGPRAFVDGAGHFWLILETRPYMRARAGLAEVLAARGDRDAAVEHYRDMLHLNPNDSQGVRYLLAARLVEMGRDDELGALLGRYDDAMAAWAYTKALLAFRREGDSRRARELLVEAIETNRHVAAYLLGKKKLPEERPEYIGLGDENEAVSYAAENIDGWRGTPGALDWLRSTPLS